MNNIERLEEQFAAVGKHAAALSQLYYRGAAAEDGMNEQAALALVQKKVALRDSIDGSLQLHEDLMRWAQDVMSEAAGAAVGTNATANMDALEGLVEVYQNAIRKNAVSDQDEAYRQISRIVRTMIAEITGSSRRLWHDISEAFLDIGNIELRYQFSRTALQSAERILVDILMVRRDRVERLSLGKPELRSLLNELVVKVERAALNFEDAIARLQVQLYRLERMRADAQFVRGFNRYLRETPDFSIEDIGIPTLSMAAINPASPVELTATFSVLNKAYEQELAELAFAVSEKVGTEQREATDRPVTVAVEQIAFENSDGQAELTAFFRSVDEMLVHAEEASGEWVTASRVWHEAEVATDFDIWLFAILDECQEEDGWRRIVDVDVEKEFVPGFSGNTVVRDVKLRLRVA